jgi:predicted glycoside hydrolase/deacetylase ChbG (UPF0249 family)
MKTEASVMDSAKTSTGVRGLILNADDWGRDRETTQRIFECIQKGTVSSTSAMVFMADSKRGADLARENGVDAGLHLNFTTPFDASGVKLELMDHHNRVFRYLRRHRLAQAIYHPGLTGSFEYVVRAQIEEYQRLFGSLPERIDGHHHMHLCANVIRAKLLPEGTIVRRNNSFQPGQKSFVNRLYRGALDRKLARRHRLTDYFYSLPPLSPPQRLRDIFGLASSHIVEVETHPVNPQEYRFLQDGEIYRYAGDTPIAASFAPVRPCSTN